MRKAIALFSLLSVASAGLAEETVQIISRPHEQVGARKVANDTDQPRTVNVLTLENPRVTRDVYAVTGKVRCENVAGKAYLEMWSHFPGGGAYYTRTLAPSGPMRHLEGSSDWRAFVLPFDKNKVKDNPAKLVVNVVLPGRGTVHLGEARLVQYGPGEDPLAVAAAGAWWSNRAGGLIGGIAGSLLGLAGALIGCLAGTGKARGPVTAAMKALLVVGVVLLLAGGLALAWSQPYGVYYPLLLLGGLLTVTLGGLFVPIRRRYEQVELRRISAMDAA